MAVLVRHPNSLVIEVGVLGTQINVGHALLDRVCFVAGAMHRYARLPLLSSASLHPALPFGAPLPMKEQALVWVRRRVFDEPENLVRRKCWVVPEQAVGRRDPLQVWHWT